MGEQRSAMPPLSRADFSSLVDAHQARLYAFLYGLVGHPEQAFDLVQDTFCDAWRAAQQGTLPFIGGAPMQDVRRWLFHVGYHHAISLLRRKRLIQWESLDGLDDFFQVSDAIPSFEEQVVESAALQAALAQLAPPDVACLLLRIVQGFSAAEVGTIMGISPENATKRLSRAKQRLRAVYFQQNHLSEERARP